MVLMSVMSQKRLRESMVSVVLFFLVILHYFLQLLPFEFDDRI